MKELSFCHKLKYSYPISLQPNVVDHRYFKLLILLDQINIKGLPTGCRDIEIRKFEVVAKTQSLYKGIEFLPQIPIL